MNSATSESSGRSRSGAILIYILAFLLTSSAAVKLVHIPQITAQMAELGFDGSKLTLIAVLELGSAILFAYPRTRFFGLLMVSAYLGGAIATHIGHDQLRPQPAVVLALAWFAVWMRHREWFRNPADRRAILPDAHRQSMPSVVLGDRT